jgi:hypothetical protein
MEERTINEVELYEVGPVVFPAYEQTSVGVRSRDALAALEDAQVREEVAHILAAGGDLRSISTIDISADSNEVHSAANDSPAESHLSLPTKTQRLAKVMLAGIDPERD